MPAHAWPHTSSRMDMLAEGSQPGDPVHLDGASPVANPKVLKLDEWRKVGRARWDVVPLWPSKGFGRAGSAGRKGVWHGVAWLAAMLNEGCDASEPLPSRRPVAFCEGHPMGCIAAWRVSGREVLDMHMVSTP